MQTTPPEVTQSRDGDVAVLTFNRPEKRNALSRRLLALLASALDQLDQDKGIRAVIITGGDKFFSSGADLGEALAVSKPDELAEYLSFFAETNSKIESLSKPVIAAINGTCYTGGLELALACDLRIADETAIFAMTSSRIGSLAGAGGTQRLPRMVGLAKAKELLLLAETIAAPEALRIGLIHRMCGSGQAANAALEMAQVLRERAPLSLAYAKRAVQRGIEMPLETALAFERGMVADIFQTNDRHEGMAAFLEKRPPRFEGN